MAVQFTNHTNIHPIIAAWLINRNYDLIDYVPNLFTATAFNKPIRESILSEKMRRGEITVLGETITETSTDISSLLKSCIGTAIHSSLDTLVTSTETFAENLSKLFNDKVVQKYTQGIVTELRTPRAFEGYTISGKFDLVVGGQLFDYKTTSTYSWNKTSKLAGYQIQGSIYKWLNPSLITHPVAVFLEVYTDWTANKLLAQPQNYPPNLTNTIEVELLSSEQTEEFMRSYLAQYEEGLQCADQSDLPECTPDELWMDEPEYKYYTKPNQTRATKNFKKDKSAAYKYLASQGNKGFIKECPSQARKCLYCPVFQVCNQAKELQERGLLNASP